MAYTFGARLDDDSYALTTIDEDQGTATTKGEINGVPFEGGGGGSSDFSTAEVTVTAANGVEVDVGGASVDSEQLSLGQHIVGDGTPLILDFVLYKGEQYISIMDSATMEDYDMSKVAVTGDLAKDEYGITITGDGTITISE